MIHLIFIINIFMRLNFVQQSFEPFGFKNWSSFNEFVAFVNVQPILFDQFSISLVCVVKLSEFEIVICIVVFPFFWDFGSSPKPSTFNDQISFVTIDTQSSESIFSKVIKISNETIFQVASQISNFSLSFV